MAEVLLSPGVAANESDQSFISGQPVQAGAAIVGPTVKGPVGIPTLVTSYSEYQRTFGAVVESGSAEYTYFTSISAYNYFQQGGSSLLVTRAVSGSYTSATSTAIQNDVESGDIADATNLFSSYTSGGTGGDAAVYANIATSGGTGSGLKVTATKSSGSGKLLSTADALLASITTQPTNGSIASHPSVALTGSLSGTGAVATVVLDAVDNVSSITVTTTGSGFVTGETITFPSASVGASVGGGVDPIFTLVAGDFFVETTALVATGSHAGYAVGDVITVANGVLGGGTDLTFTLVDGDIVDQTAFVLETLSEGAIVNSGIATGSNGTLLNGTRDNIRWEITAPNTSSGTFALVIRRGDDTQTQKTILETWTGLSLDPNSNSYIEKVIGNSKQTVTQDAGTGEYYVANAGTYNTLSNFVRVKSVTSKTLNYFDNNGDAKSQYTASIPVAGSGSFTGAVGTPFASGDTAKFYENIDGTDTQGLIADNYTIPLQLLANRDAYRYNLITTPGLYNADYAAPLSTMINNSTFRGDNLSIIDLVKYGQGINSVTAQASARDSSYATNYWPWLQTIDPDLGSLVWVPASAMMPGVYAFNDRAGEAWFAPAGLNRGGLGTVVRAERKLTNGNRDTLYTNNINPIATFPSTGVVVFGQKTMQKKASALDRVNVRRLLIALKNYISQIADNLVFEANTIATRNNFLSQVNPYLESVQQRQGLYAFKVVMDESNNTPDVIDRNQLIGQIYVQPTKTAEFIYLDFNILPTGATFPV
jgi:hypothetical protein